MTSDQVRRPRLESLGSSPPLAPAAGSSRGDPEAGSAGRDRRARTLADLGIRPHNCFACGELNASGMRLPLHLEPGHCWTELTLPARFEGWEGVIHGGILSTILDEVMGWALMESDSWGVTARLSVTFRAPVSPGQPIFAEGWITDQRRRVQRTAARILDRQTGTELVSAEAVYVSATESRKRELQERYGLRGLSRSPTGGERPAGRGGDGEDG